MAKALMDKASFKSICSDIVSRNTVHEEFIHSKYKLDMKPQGAQQDRSRLMKTLSNKSDVG
jgi:hypothetical protein